MMTFKELVSVLDYDTEEIRVVIYDGVSHQTYAPKLNLSQAIRSLFSQKVADWEVMNIQIKPTRIAHYRFGMKEITCSGIVIDLKAPENVSQEEIDRICTMTQLNAEDSK